MMLGEAAVLRLIPSLLIATAADRVEANRAWSRGRPMVELVGSVPSLLGADRSVGRLEGSEIESWWKGAL